MTPQQSAKCDLLEVSINELYQGLYSVHKLGQPNCILVIDRAKFPNPIFPQKLFHSVNKAIIAAAAPEKLGLRWSQ